MAPAKGTTAFGGEMLALPVFYESSGAGTSEYIKLPEFFIPNAKKVEPLVLDVRSYDERLYNRYLEVFGGSAGADSFQTSFFDSSTSFPVQEAGRFSFTAKPKDGKDGSSTEITSIERLVKFKSQTSASLDGSFTENNAVFEWQGESRRIPRYFKRASSDAGFEPVLDDSEVPAALKKQEYMETHTSQRFQAHNGRRKRDWCYDCNPTDSDKCEAVVRETTLGDGSLIRYRWWRFRDQPVFQQLAKEFPEKYSEAFLDNLQTIWAALHMHWGAGEAGKFLKRPSSRSDYTMAKLDPGLLLTPPPGKEAGWVPITLELKYRDNNTHATKSSTASTTGDAKKGRWWRPSKNPFWIDERRVDYTGGFTPATSNYDKQQWIDDDTLGKVDFQRDDDRMLDDDYRDWTFTPSSAPTISMAPTNVSQESSTATPTAEADINFLLLGSGAVVAVIAMMAVVYRAISLRKTQSEQQQPDDKEGTEGDMEESTAAEETIGAMAVSKLVV
jgi:hypothetical protein